MRVRCMNLLCDAPPFDTKIKTLDKLKKIKCKQCKYSVMPEGHVLVIDEIWKQVRSWYRTVLYRDAFKQIQIDKLPKNMDQQTIDITFQKRFDNEIDIDKILAEAITKPIRDEMRGDAQ